MVKPVLLIRADNNEMDEVALAKLGIPSLIDPYIEIKTANDSTDGKRLLSVLESSEGLVWLIATSVNSFKHWAQIVGEDRLRSAIVGRPNLKFAAIGETTANVLRNLGADQVFLAKDATGKSLADELVGAYPVGHAFIPGGNLAMKTLPATLLAGGWQASTAVVYTTSRVETEPASARLVRERQVSAILFRSPSAVRALSHFVPNPEVPLVCAGVTTAQALADLGLKAAVLSPKPSAQVVASTVYSLLC